VLSENSYPHLLRVAVALWVLLTSAVTLADEDPVAGQAHLAPGRLVEAVLTQNATLPTLEAAWEEALSRIPQLESLEDPMVSYSIAPLAAMHPRTVGDPDPGFGQISRVEQGLPWPDKLRLRGKAASPSYQSLRIDEPPQLASTAWGPRGLTAGILGKHGIILGLVMASWRRMPRCALR
jgi:hypothetical protein